MGKQCVFLKYRIKLAFIWGKVGDILSVKNNFPVVRSLKSSRIRSSVVFPQPLGPNSVKNLFSLIYRFKSSNTRLSPYDLKCVKCQLIFSPYKILLVLKTRWGCHPYNLCTVCFVCCYIMFRMGNKVKRFPFFGSVYFLPTWI